MLVKICGLQSVEAAQVAIDAGTDFLGIICVPNRKRTVDAEVAKQIAERAASSKASLVGVFRNQSPEEVELLAKEYNLDVIQLHGSEDPREYQFGLPIIKRFVPGQENAYSGHDYTLFDSEAGGTGEILDWTGIEALARESGIKYILAGGLTPENVNGVSKLYGCIGCDVSGGVETDGVKDLTKIKQFVERGKQ